MLKRFAPSQKKRKKFRNHFLHQHLIKKDVGKDIYSQRFRYEEDTFNRDRIYGHLEDKTLSEGIQLEDIRKRYQ